MKTVLFLCACWVISGCPSPQQPVKPVDHEAEPPAVVAAEKEQTTEYPLGVISLGDDSPNIIGGTGTVIISNDGRPWTEISREENDLFLEEHICPVCKRKSSKSKVWCDSWAGVTLLGCGNGHYDEMGTYVPSRPCNTATYSCSCSEEHRWAVSEPSY